jgi:ribosomal protein S18 acetylase RimI-like enzyme
MDVGDFQIVELREKPPADLSNWFEVMWTGYREELLGSGMTEDEADKNIERNTTQLFNGDQLAEGQYVLDVVNEGETIGTLWLADRSPQGAGGWFIYDIVVDEAFRGRGFGRKTMEAGEEFVRAYGGTRLGLNVFGPNLVARNLYESMDYQVMAVSMFKDLD